jgi:hypothetical protein
MDNLDDVGTSTRLAQKKKERLARVLEESEGIGGGAESTVRRIKGHRLVVKMMNNSITARYLVRDFHLPPMDTPRAKFAAEAARLVILRRKMGRLAARTWIDPKRGIIVQEYLPSKRKLPTWEQMAELDSNLKKKGLLPWDVAPRNVAIKRSGKAVVIDLGGVDWKKTKKNIREFERIYKRLLK